MMRRVAIVGIGMRSDPGSWHPLVTWKEMLCDAAFEAFEDTQGRFTAADVDACVFAFHGEACLEQGGISGSVSDALGISPAPVYNLSTNCSGGNVALSEAVAFVGSGQYDHVLIAGLDKESDLMNYGEAIQLSYDTEYDYKFGFGHRNGLDLLSNAYERRYGYSEDIYTALGYYSRKYGAENPKAHYYRQPLTWEQCEAQGKMASCAVFGEGAAAAIVVPAEEAYKYTDHPVYVDGISFKCASHYAAHRFGEPPMGNRYPEGPDRLVDVCVAVADAAGKEAYEQAGITAEDVQFVQCNELLACTYVALEGLGIFERGKSPVAAKNGEFGLDGRCPVNTDGGGIARGHCSGADGLYQIGEAVLQLRGQAAGRQIKDCNCGVVSAVGSVFAHYCCSVLTNDNFKRR